MAFIESSKEIYEFNSHWIKKYEQYLKNDEFKDFELLLNSDSEYFNQRSESVTGK